MTHPEGLRTRIDALRAERAALRVEAAALQRMADERMAGSMRLTLEILELEERVARLVGAASPFP
jgi:hypothetical protein